MSLKDKYADLLKLGEELKVKDGDVYEKDAKLVVKGTTEYQYEKDQLWDKIKSYSGWDADLIADIKVEKTDVYGYHVVKSGDSLSKIAKSAYDNVGDYMRIFEANKDILKNPDLIHPGQRLKLPNKG
jgi:nucleoid-associated protein YgaU